MRHGRLHRVNWTLLTAAAWVLRVANAATFVASAGVTVRFAVSRWRDARAAAARATAARATTELGGNGARAGPDVERQDDPQAAPATRGSRHYVRPVVAVCLTAAVEAAGIAIATRRVNVGVVWARARHRGNSVAPGPPCCACPSPCIALMCYGSLSRCTASLHLACRALLTLSTPRCVRCLQDWVLGVDVAAEHRVRPRSRRSRCGTDAVRAVHPRGAAVLRPATEQR
jgi:hypothetical protein